MSEPANRATNQNSDQIRGGVGRAVVGRCPRCGRGRLFNGALRLSRSCDVCGVSFAKLDSGDGSAFFVISLLLVIAGSISLILELTGGESWIVHVTIWSISVVGMTLLLLRPAKGLFIGLQARFEEKTR